MNWDRINWNIFTGGCGGATYLLLTLMTKTFAWFPFFMAIVLAIIFKELFVWWGKKVKKEYG